VLTIDGTGSSVTLASGGHPPALLIRADGTADFLPTPGGVIVGIIPEAAFVTRTVALAPGDTLLLYTDGLTEALTEGRARFGADALLAFARRQPATGAADLIDRLKDLLSTLGRGLEDDVALMALSIAPDDRRG
jgi:sigma-B regulation protein RsbU (phosphoserine phosphatase)